MPLSSKNGKRIGEQLVHGGYANDDVRLNRELAIRELAGFDSLEQVLGTLSAFGST